MFQNNAEKLLESHLKFAHPIAGGSNNDNKPEKFPRPELKNGPNFWSLGMSIKQSTNSSLPVAPRTFVPRTMGGSQIDKTEIQLLQLIIMDRI
jgi:hypothetical protein